MLKFVLPKILMSVKMKASQDEHCGKWKVRL